MLRWSRAATGGPWPERPALPQLSAAHVCWVVVWYDAALYGLGTPLILPPLWLSLHRVDRCALQCEDLTLTTSVTCVTCSPQLPSEVVPAPQCTRCSTNAFIDPKTQKCQACDPTFGFAATCNATSAITCKPGYTKVGSKCLKVRPLIGKRW